MDDDLEGPMGESLQGASGDPDREIGGPGDNSQAEVAEPFDDVADADPDKSDREGHNTDREG